MAQISQIFQGAENRPDLDDFADLQEALLEVYNDLSEVKRQWNAVLYPLLGSLPSQRVQRNAADRNDNRIDPADFGFDGSQMFMDQTSLRADVRFYSVPEGRPKTIKEVVEENYVQLFNEMNVVRGLLDDVNAAAAPYDDTELRNWVKLLAAETYDPGEIAQGATVPAAIFAGAPAKASALSLNTRDKNIRHLIGVEGEAHTLQDFTNAAAIFAPSTYLDNATSLVHALLLLDTEIAGFGGAATLQSAYDNGTSILTAGAAFPIFLRSNAEDDPVLALRGSVFWQEFATGTSRVEQQVTYSGDATDNLTSHSSYANVLTSADNEYFTYTHRTGSSLNFEESALYVGKQTATGDEALGSLALGRETVAQGSGPQIFLAAYDAAGTPKAKLDVKKEFTETYDDLVTTKVLDEWRIITGNHAPAFVANPGAFAVVALTDIEFHATESITLNATDDLLFTGTKQVITLSDWATGEGILWQEGVTERMTARAPANLFADDTWSGVSGSATDSEFKCGAVRVAAYAPLDKSGTDYGGEIGSLGVPSPNTLYRNNLCKAKCVVGIDVSKDGWIEYATVQDTFNVWFQEDVTGSSFASANGQITIKFHAALPTDDFSVTTGYESTNNVMHFKILSKSTTQVVLQAYKWSGGDWVSNAWSGDATDDFVVHVQVI